jgi:hypothetical protein
MPMGFCMFDAGTATQTAVNRAGYPEKQSVTEIQLKSDDYWEIQAVLCCGNFTTGAHLIGSIEAGFDAVYVSDDFLEDRDDPRFWFQVDADRNPPSSHPIAGLGLALGTDPTGAGCDVKISVAGLAARVTSTQRKFRGFEFSQGRGKIANHLVEIMRERCVQWYADRPGSAHLHGWPWALDGQRVDRTAVVIHEDIYSNRYAGDRDARAEAVPISLDIWTNR